MWNPKIIALIPARYDASRFPGKLLKLLGNKTVIRRTYEAVRDSRLFHDVYVVCDDARISKEIESCGGKTIMSGTYHESGTDRIAEAAAGIDADIVVNVQGDEPFMDSGSLKKVIALFENPATDIATLRMRIRDKERIEDPNCVKVVCNEAGKALYFSRSPIPFHRDTAMETIYYQHIGVYAFRKEVLMRFSKLPQSHLEKIEKLENLRMLEHGMQVYLAEVQQVGIAIDTEADLQRAAQYLEKEKN